MDKNHVNNCDLYDECLDAKGHILDRVKSGPFQDYWYCNRCGEPCDCDALLTGYHKGFAEGKRSQS